MLTKFPPGRISGARVQDDDAPSPCVHGKPGTEASAHSGGAAADEGGGSARQNADKASPPRVTAPDTGAQLQQASA
ncbi:MAG: hypothetical protein IKW48_05220 [Akkermansia sp.]|nr:hypothetical protein [Akkermansia sp.]